MACFVGAHAFGVGRGRHGRGSFSGIPSAEQWGSSGGEACAESPQLDVRAGARLWRTMRSEQMEKLRRELEAGTQDDRFKREEVADSAVLYVSRVKDKEELGDPGHHVRTAGRSAEPEQGPRQGGNARRIFRRSGVNSKRRKAGTRREASPRAAERRAKPKERVDRTGVRSAAPQTTRAQRSPGAGNGCWAAGGRSGG